MPSKESELKNSLWAGVKGGCVTVAMTLLLLFPAVFLFSRGTIKLSDARYPVLALAFVSAFLSQRIAVKEKGGGGLLTAVISCAAAVFLLMLLTAGMPQTRLSAGTLLPSAASVLAGDLLGSFIHFNKKYTRRKKKRKKYNR